MTQLKCMNCGTPTGSDGKLFAEVFVCPHCHAIATRILERGQTLLRRLNVLLRDTIRYALQRGKIDFPAKEGETVDDMDLLRRIVGLYTEKETCLTPMASTRSSLPVVRRAAS